MTRCIYEIMAAAAVPPSVKTQIFGQWEIIKQPLPIEMVAEALGRTEFTALINYINVNDICWSKMHLMREDDTIPDVVMEDSPQELKKHLPIWMHGKGHVLKTGLGLGCVVRGLLAKKEVELITVIEIDADVIRVIGEEFKQNSRVKIYHADALEFDYTKIPHIDYAWHDIWVPQNDGLQVEHMKLIQKCAFKNTVQGAWNFPRFGKKICAKKIRMIG